MAPDERPRYAAPDLIEKTQRREAPAAFVPSRWTRSKENSENDKNYCRHLPWKVGIALGEMKQSMKYGSRPESRWGVC